MKITLWINDIKTETEIAPDQMLFGLLRKQGCKSVKCGCDTTNCGLCTVWLEGTPVLSCSVPAARANGKHVTTLEGLQKEAEDFGRFLAAQTAEQCGYCNTGFIMNVLAMVRELDNPTVDEVKAYLSGNLCRCTGYQGQLRALKNYLAVVHGNTHMFEEGEVAEDGGTF